MKKVLLLIDCDGCRRLYPYCRFASEDVTAWELHGNNIVRLAKREGWGESFCRNFQYCPDCIEEDERLAMECI